MGKKKQTIDKQTRNVVSGFIQSIERKRLTVRSGSQPGGEEEVEFKEELSEGIFTTLLKMQSSGIPVYAEEQDDDNWFFACPLKVRITGVETELNNGRRSLEIPGLPIPAYLLESNIRFTEILAEITWAITNDRMLWIAVVQYTSNGEHQGYWEVLGVVGRVDSPAEPCVRPAETQYDESSHQEISVGRAQEIFQEMKSKSSDLDALEEGGIPFLFLDTVCVTQVHEMCRLIRQEGVHPLKLWAFDTFNRPNLKATTINHPRCQIEWSFHVAPILRTFEGHYVIDPSLTDYAVPVNDWLNLFASDNMRLYSTSDHIYTMSSDQLWLTSDPYYETTQSDLEMLRICFRLFIDRFGKPPYATCVSP